MTVSLLAGAYLFFGGAGAGTLFFVLLLDEICCNRASIVYGHRFEEFLTRRGYALTLMLLIVGIICLVFDLGRPNAALLVLLRPTWSYLTVGAYLLCICVGAAAVLLMTRRFMRRRVYSVVIRAVRLLAMLCALAMMVYTGLLLSSLQPIPLWNSSWLPPLFLASSLAAGAACMTLCAALPDQRPALRIDFERRYAVVDLVLVMVELAFTAALLVSVADSELGSQSIAALLGGGVSQALFCGGFMLCGIVIPVVGDVLVLMRRSGIYMTAAVASLCLIGCFCLRLALVAAGIHVGV